MKLNDFLCRDKVTKRAPGSYDSVLELSEANRISIQTKLNTDHVGFAEGDVDMLFLRTQTL